MTDLTVDFQTVLRKYEDQNAEEIFAAVVANYDHLHTFLHWVTPDYSLESAKEFIAQSQKASVEKQSEAYGIFYAGKLAGSIGFVKFSWDSRRTEIGYWIGKEFEGRGLITKSSQVLINYAFSDLDMNRVEIQCATENVKSRAVPERLGFKLEGILRQSMWRHTRLYDVAIYGLLKEEWRTFNI